MSTIKLFSRTAPRWRSTYLVLPLAAAVIAAAAPAAVTVHYVGTRAVGSGSVGLLIDTDGSTGTLSAANIVAWTITLHDPSSATPLRMLTNDGAGGSLRSAVVVGGPAVTATSTALSFTYGLGALEFNASYTIKPFYQIVSALCSTGGFGNYGGCEQFDTGSDFSSSHVRYALHPAADTIVIATAAPVPEPAAWSLMIVGFGLVGRILRSRAATAGRIEASAPRTASSAE